MGTQDRLTADLDSFFDDANLGLGETGHDPASTEETTTDETGDGFDRVWSDDPVVRVAQINAAIDADEADARKNADAWLDGVIEHVTKTGNCCKDGPHWDQNGVLAMMLELNTADIDRAWKAWHERTLTPDVKGKGVEKAAEELGAKLALKKKYEIRRFKHTPPPGRIKDHNGFEDALDEALSRVIR